MPRDDPQINVRLPTDRREILDAAVFVLGKGTASKLVHELVEEAIDRYARLATVEAALAAKHQQAEADANKIARLRVRHDRSVGEGQEGT